MCFFPLKIQKTLEDKLLYLPTYDKQNHPFCILRLLVEILHLPVSNQSIKIPCMYILKGLSLLIKRWVPVKIADPSPFPSCVLPIKFQI